MRAPTALALALVACASPPPSTLAPAPTRAPTPAPAPTSTPAPAGRIGDPCTVDPNAHFARGSCADGLFCARGPGGVCTAMCPCADGVACVPTGRMGELCMKSCASDADCRTSEGFACDPGWHACVLPRVASPKLAVCNNPALARKTFGAAEQIATARGPGAYHLEPSAALTSRGDVLVTYIAASAPGTVHPLGMATLLADGTKKIDVAFPTNRENHFDPWMAASKRGSAYVVWLGFDGAFAPEKRAIIGFAKSDDGATWGAPRVANDVAIDCPNEAPGCLDKPIIAVGPDRRDPKREAIYVAYWSEPADAFKLVRSIDGGDTFSASVKIGSDAYGDLEVGDDGVVHVVYTTDDGKIDRFGDKRTRVEHTRSTDGGASFSAPVVVSAAGEVLPYFFSNAQIVPDDRRKLLYVVYTSGGPDGRWDVMLAVSRDAGATWTRAKVNDDAPCANHMTPMAALDRATGKVHVAWLENRTGSGAVAYAACAAPAKSGAPVCAPNEAVSDAPFASYVLTRHSPQWLGEYGTLLVDDTRRALHVLWTQTVDERSGPTARIFHARGKL